MRLPDSIRLPDDYPEQLGDLLEVLFERLAKHDLPEDAAARIALDQVEAVRDRFLGANLYLPKYNSQRNDEIWRKFNGRNQAELARKYGLTVARIYQILARERTKRQAVLF